jgi:histidinol dehydrogenase
MQNDLHHITQHFEQLYVSNGKLLSKEDTILENSIEAEPQQKEQVESVVVNVQPITPPVSTQTHESEDEWKRIFEEFSSKTATLEKEYVNIALQVAELERSTEEAKKYGEHNVDERQQIIETMQEEMNEIKNQVYLRKYSERAFFDYFFRTGESLERVKELKKHLETFTTKRTSEKIANDYPEMQNHVQNIDRLTEYITGIPMNQFLTSMEEICQQKEEIKQDSDEKQKGTTYMIIY